MRYWALFEYCINTSIKSFFSLQLSSGTRRLTRNWRNSLAWNIVYGVTLTASVNTLKNVVFDNIWTSNLVILKILTIKVSRNENLTSVASSGVACFDLGCAVATILTRTLWTIFLQKKKRAEYTNNPSTDVSAKFHDANKAKTGHSYWHSNVCPKFTRHYWKYSQKANQMSPLRYLSLENCKSNTTRFTRHFGIWHWLRISRCFLTSSGT